LAREADAPMARTESPFSPLVSCGFGCLCALVLGLALGLYGGCLFHTVLMYWENAMVTVKAFRSAFSIVLPVGGGSLAWWLNGKISISFYILGLGLGLVVTYVWPRRASRYSLEDVKCIVRMSDDLRKVRDIKKRALLILASIFPPKRIRWQEGISQEELAKKLEEATDAFTDDKVNLRATDGENRK
jgi:hypothetical protein